MNRKIKHKERAVIVLPTYNEKENIKNLLTTLLLQRQKITQYDLHVLVVDDASPDGTSNIVKSFIKHHKTVHLLTGKKQGLGIAYTRGFRYAIEQLQAAIIFEMDADFSHNPTEIPRFLRAITKGSDFVIGSRYITGGSIPNNWSYFRKLNSKFGNVFARHIAGLRNIQDCTSGYRAIRTNILKRVDCQSLNVKGYGFQISLLHACLQEDANVTEIPIKFIDRIHGNSKLQTKDIIEFICNAGTLRSQIIKKEFTKVLKRKQMIQVDRRVSQ